MTSSEIWGFQAPPPFHKKGENSGKYVLDPENATFWTMKASKASKTIKFYMKNQVIF